MKETKYAHFGSALVIDAGSVEKAAVVRQGAHAGGVNGQGSLKLHVSRRLRYILVKCGLSV